MNIRNISIRPASPEYFKNMYTNVLQSRVRVRFIRPPAASKKRTIMTG